MAAAPAFATLAGGEAAAALRSLPARALALGRSWAASASPRRPAAPHGPAPPPAAPWPLASGLCAAAAAAGRARRAPQRRAARGAPVPSQPEATAAATPTRCSPCGAGCACPGEHGRREALAAAAVGIPMLGGQDAARAAKGDGINGELRLKFEKVCLYCNEGAASCGRCRGTGTMVGMDEGRSMVPCTECSATGYKLCGACSGSGCSKPVLKRLRKDPAFKKVLAKTVYEAPVMDEAGRKALAEKMASAIEKAELYVANKAAAKAAAAAREA